MLVSLAIPTRDRLAKLERTVESLAEQDPGEHELEVVIVDNGSSDGTADWLAERAREFPFPFRWETEPRVGASQARNTAMRLASGEVILFIGDDTRPAGPDFVRGHADLHARRPEAPYAVLGLAEWAPELAVTPLMEWLESGVQWDFGSLEPGPVPHERLVTANVSLKRPFVLEAGGFEQRIPVFFEDLELAVRLHERGMELDYHPELLVLHDHATPLRASLARQRIAGRSARLLNNEIAQGGPILPVPAGPRWRIARLTGLALERVPARREWARLPRRARERIYKTLHLAAYASGYDERRGP